MPELSDYRRWNSAHLPDEERDAHFIAEVLPNVYNIPSGPMMTMLDDHPWLKDLVSTEDDPPVRNALAEYRRSPNETTLRLAAFVKAFTATLVIDIIMTGPFLVAFADMTSEERDLPFKPEQITVFRELVEAELKRLPTHQAWKILKRQVAKFCLEAGLPETGYDPLDNIASLRRYGVSQWSGSNNAMLQAEIERLRIICASQQRIITNLAFRHAMEMLPGPKPVDLRGRPLNSTEHWQNFWSAAWEKAKRLNRQDTSHPLKVLLEDFPDRQRQIDSTAKQLYGTLSSNIHHYNPQFDIDDQQWDVLPCAILRAITPTTERKPDGGVDWNAERQRYQLDP